MDELTGRHKSMNHRSPPKSQRHHTPDRNPDDFFEIFFDFFENGGRTRNSRERDTTRRGKRLGSHWSVSGFSFPGGGRGCHYSSSVELGLVRQADLDAVATNPKQALGDFRLPYFTDSREPLATRHSPRGFFLPRPKTTREKTPEKGRNSVLT